MKSGGPARKMTAVLLLESGQPVETFLKVPFGRRVGTAHPGPAVERQGFEKSSDHDVRDTLRASRFRKVRAALARFYRIRSELSVDDGLELLIRPVRARE